jgi:hypothetical protein
MQKLIIEKSILLSNSLKNFTFFASNTIINHLFLVKNYNFKKKNFRELF